jgi:hypothetical protein
MSPATIAFVFFAIYTSPDGHGVYSINVPGIADENECHKLALKVNAPKHACFDYRMAVPQIDKADALQDAQRDGLIR